jgi:hypothetical protein
MEQAKEYALSDDDIRQLLGGDIKITTYPDLDKVHHLSELFDRKGRAILFVPQTDQTTGHWTALIKNGREVEFFDPYGEEPEKQKSGLSGGKLAELRMKEPLLANLLDESGCKIYFNKVQLQELSNDVNTCGRHCVCRLLYYKFPIERYRAMIKRSGDTPDDFVINMTYKELGR